MDYLFGIKGKDFVMLVSDTAAVQQIINIKHDEDKLVQIDPHKIMGLAGNASIPRSTCISYPHFFS